MQWFGNSVLLRSCLFRGNSTPFSRTRKEEKVKLSTRRFSCHETNDWKLMESILLSFKLAPNTIC